MRNSVKIVECPRDAWQGLHGMIPAETKAGYLRMLIDAGFQHIDAVSFVSPAAVPQMADSERVLEILQPPTNAEIIGIVVNAKGTERAIATGAVRTLGFPYSISAEFLRRNQRQTQQESLEVLRAICGLARGAELKTVGYISMAFGNPYDDPWSETAVVEACGFLIEEGVSEISLADTVGVAKPDQIAETVAAAITAFRYAEIGVHLHARRNHASERVRAAYEAGCRRFDAAIGGLGGCPFAQDALLGNLPTEILMETLKKCGAEVPALRGMEALIAASAEIAQGCGVAAESGTN
jgi:hydroxymethylglutaryl-CoA lyase